MTNKIFNRKHLLLHRNRVAKLIKQHSFLFNLFSDEIYQRYKDFNLSNNNILEIGSRYGQLHKNFIQNEKYDNYIQTDISEKMLEHNQGNLVVMDEEFISFKNNSFDLILSPASLNWVNDLPGCLIQIYKIIKNNGLFLANLAGGRSLYQLQEVLMESEVDIAGGFSPRISPTIDIKTLGGLVQRAGFKEPVIDSQIIQIAYKDLLDLIYDLKNSGESNVILNRNYNIRRDVINKADKKYKKLYGDGNNGIIADFEILSISAFK